MAGGAFVAAPAPVPQVRRQLQQQQKQTQMSMPGNLRRWHGREGVVAAPAAAAAAAAAAQSPWSSSGMQPGHQRHNHQHLRRPAVMMQLPLQRKEQQQQQQDHMRRDDDINSQTGDGGASTTPGALRQKGQQSKKRPSSVQRRILTGVAMGVVVIGVIFGGRWPFLLLMLFGQLLGQAEYYRMVIAKGHSPAFKTGLIVTTTLLFTTACLPALADAVFPVGGTVICIYLLFRRREIATIADISTTFMGLFYAGYLPSFWVRLHGYKAVSGGAVATPLGGILARLWPSPLLPVSPVLEIGPMLVFWTWLSVASADIGAFFVGRAFGRTRFSSISPKKTLEGAVAGFLCSASVSMLGAFLLRWPMWSLTGALYGIAVGVVGLFGDLTASSFKRDVGWKDSGQLFPGHGGILDRADSYVLIAPLVYYFTTLVLPLLGMR